MAQNLPKVLNGSLLGGDECITQKHLGAASPRPALPCRTAAAVRLRRRALAGNLRSFVRIVAVSKQAARLSPTGPCETLTGIGAKIVGHGCCGAFQPTEVAVSRQMSADIPSPIARLRTVRVRTTGAGPGARGPSHSAPVETGEERRTGRKIGEIR
jgi:hypothetical protein